MKEMNGRDDREDGRRRVGMRESRRRGEKGGDVFPGCTPPL